MSDTSVQSFGLVVVRVAEHASAESKLRVSKASFGTMDGPWDEAEWFRQGSVEVNSVHCVAPIESMTGEQYDRISEVTLPFNTGYELFEGVRRPPLHWIKGVFPNHAAVLYCYRPIRLAAETLDTTDHPSRHRRWPTDRTNDTEAHNE